MTVAASGCPVAHRLTHRHDIGYETVRLVTPPVRAGSAEPGLHLIRNEQRPGSTDLLRNRRKEAARRFNHAGTRHDRIDDKRGGTHAATGQRCERLVDGLRISYAGIVAAMRAAINVRGRNRHDVVGHLGGRDILDGNFIGRLRITVVRIIGNDEPGAAGAGTRNTHRELVRFAAGAAEHHRVELVGKLSRQPFRVIQNIVVQVARVRIEERCLFRQRLDDMRMTMADMRYVVVHVQVLAAGAVVQPAAFATHDVHRLVVKQPVGRPKQLAAARDHGVSCSVQ